MRPARPGRRQAMIREPPNVDGSGAGVGLDAVPPPLGDEQTLPGADHCRVPDRSQRRPAPLPALVVVAFESDWAGAAGVVRCVFGPEKQAVLSGECVCSVQSSSDKWR